MTTHATADAAPSSTRKDVQTVASMASPELHHERRVADVAANPLRRNALAAPRDPRMRPVRTEQPRRWPCRKPRERRLASARRREPLRDKGRIVFQMDVDDAVRGVG